MRVFAPAKINLTLKVGPARADGRHPLASVVAFADVGDWIEATPAAELCLNVTGPFAGALAAEADNLVLRAARALQAATGCPQGAALTLEKHLPIASGIGGGSADAAAALRALAVVWGLKLDDGALQRIAAGLGADVPVCVLGRAAYMTGAGEITEPIQLPRLHAVLANPLKPAPTAAVYARFDALGLGGPIEAPAPVWDDAAAAHAGAAALGNDLLTAALEVEPALDLVASALRGDKRARHVGLSGSGATMFALVDDAASAAALAQAVARPDWWVRAVQLG